MSRKNNIFTQVPIQRQKKNHFDLSHEVKMSCKFANLYPILLKECLPGDQWSNTTDVMARLAPMLAPIYHRIDITVHYFYTPMRLLSDFWEDFITGGQDGTEAPVLPYLTPDGMHNEDPTDAIFKKGSLWDYFGLPVIPDGVEASSQERISVLPFRAYTKIWNDYYRDPNFDEEVDLSLNQEGEANGDDTLEHMRLRQRGWERDYFTSALAQAQRGLEVLMPFSGVATEADIDYKVASESWELSGGTYDPSPTNQDMGILYTGGPFIGTKSQAGSDYVNIAQIRNIDEIRVPNSETSINDLRRALAVQSWLENNARAGYRYNEQIFSHFATRVPDYRLQRAEYLGGGKQPIRISEVIATANSEADGGGNNPLGDIAGHGISVGNTNRFKYYAQEHGYIIGILSVMPRTAYSQGIERLWSRADKFDYAWPELAHIGEQEIVNKEVFYSFNAAQDDANAGTFGYIPRYAEYKFSNDRIAGDFRDNLGFWHLGRNFTSRPALGSAFTTMQESGGSFEETYRRIFYVQDDTDYIWIQAYHNLHAKRPLPYFGVPKIQ